MANGTCPIVAMNWPGTFPPLSSIGGRLSKIDDIRIKIEAEKKLITVFFYNGTSGGMVTSVVLKGANLADVYKTIDEQVAKLNKVLGELNG